MSGIETIVEFGCLSDEQRWVADRYDFSWLPELTEGDRKIVRLLDCLADGEFSGQASVAQLYELMIRAVESGYPKELQCDWSEIYAYGSIIAYEEMRHGLSLGKINHYVTTGRMDLFETLPVRTFGEKYVWCYDSRKYWDLYSYLLAHLFGEVVNTELYRDIRSKIAHPKLRQVMTNIMTDEARHTRAWARLIKNLLDADPRHMDGALASLEKGIIYHNAMVHETYFEGQNKMLPLFTATKGEDVGTIERIVKVKMKVLNELFGERNPMTEADIKRIHMDFLDASLGETRAQSDKDGNIQFLTDAVA